MTTMARLALCGVLAAGAAGCALRAPSIADLQHNPARYYDKTVKVDGVVTSSWGVPLLPYRMYRIDDGTGELTVLSRGQRIPTKGARVEVKGKVGELGVLGGRALGLHLQEESLQVRRN